MSRIDANANASHHRFANIDLLRGIVMVLMLLDHVRDFVHEHGLTRDPTDLQTTTPALFLTRWVSHFCAPVFVFLAGLSVRLQLLRGTSRRDVARGLVWRGLFFVALEVVVLRPLMWWNVDYSFVAHLQVIWAIGVSMFLLGLALLGHTPTALPGALGLAIVGGHNLLQHIAFDFAPWDSSDAVRMLAFGRGGIWFGNPEGPVVVVQYAWVPWLGVMLAGFACGTLWRMTPERRRPSLFVLGALATITFALLRGLRLYGDPFPWDPTQPGWRAAASFLRCEKYPPSLHYLLMTLGPGLLLLAASERVRADGAWRWLVTLGRVPLFFYVLQWPMAHALSRLFQWLDGQPLGWDGINPLRFDALPPGCGFPLEVVWLAWALGLVVLVPVCLWFARFRARRPDARWLRWL